MDESSYTLKPEEGESFGVHLSRLLVPMWSMRLIKGVPVVMLNTYNRPELADLWSFREGLSGEPTGQVRTHWVEAHPPAGRTGEVRLVLVAQVEVLLRRIRLEFALEWRFPEHKDFLMAIVRCGSVLLTISDPALNPPSVRFAIDRNGLLQAMKLARIHTEG